MITVARQHASRGLRPPSCAFPANKIRLVNDDDDDRLSQDDTRKWRSDGVPDIGRSDERGRVVGQQCGHAACFGIDFIGMISEKKYADGEWKEKRRRTSTCRGERRSATVCLAWVREDPMSLSHGSLQRTVTCTPPKGKKKKKRFRAHEVPGGEGTNVVETLYVSWWRITGYPETLPP